MGESRKFNVIVADPSWAYSNLRTGGSMTSGSAAKYDGQTMALEDIEQLPVAGVCSDDAVLFLWVTVPVLDYGFEVMKAWGFSYKTSVFWVKTGRLGMGYWFRGQVEVVLFGVRGKIKAFRTAERNMIQSVPGPHSSKPKEFRDFVERVTVSIPDRKRLELFAVGDSPGWTSLGYGADGVDLRDSLVAIAANAPVGECPVCGKLFQCLGKIAPRHVSNYGTALSFCLGSGEETKKVLMV